MKNSSFDCTMNGNAKQHQHQFSQIMSMMMTATYNEHFSYNKQSTRRNDRCIEQSINIIHRVLVLFLYEVFFSIFCVYAIEQNMSLYLHINIVPLGRKILAYLHTYIISICNVFFCLFYFSCFAFTC